jgi:MoaA/NifB/PqqE/SkfB family radical SAM enzyme
MTEAFVKLDYACNQKCLFCCTADDTVRLSFDKAKSIVRRYALDMGYELISFTGGEPCTVDYLPDIIAYTKKLGKKVKLQTNALALSDYTYAKKLIDAGIDTALISLHSHNPETHDAITQVKGSFDKSCEGIKHLIASDVDVHLSYVVTTLNKDIYSFLAYITKSFPKIQSFQFFLPWAIARGWKNKSLVPRLPDIRKYLFKGFLYCQKKNIPFSTRGIPLCYMGAFWNYASETRSLLSKKTAMIINDYEDDTPKHSFEDSNAKEPQCRLCIKNDICGGVWNTYPKIYPFDLWPIYYDSCQNNYASKD